MTSKMTIKHLKHNEIDIYLWDNTISRAVNTLPYAFSWYLDAVSPNWEALVSDDYCTVMPLPCKKKMGFQYLIQPLLTQQLGIFSVENITENVIRRFISAIPYRAYELRLNDANTYTRAADVYKNLTLTLNRPYEQLADNYSGNTLRNIGRAKKRQITVLSIDFNRFYPFWTELNEEKYPALPDVIQRICRAAEEHNTGRYYGAFTPDSEMIAAVFTLETPHRIINLLPTSSAKGMQSSAMFLMMDFLLRREALSGKIFDFEGSRIEGVARFYAGFGGENHPYFVIRKNRPKWLVRWLHLKI
ncbi:MAG: hypothetical protein LBS16_03850 [Prevotellaceae bacterium]|jgi:hypothetical protein|nr:hypothetical protein [Prevotellaceae bacterium]